MGLASQSVGFLEMLPLWEIGRIHDKVLARDCYATRI